MKKMLWAIFARDSTLGERLLGAVATVSLFVTLLLIVALVILIGLVPMKVMPATIGTVTHKEYVPYSTTVSLMPAAKTLVPMVQARGEQYVVTVTTVNGTIVSGDVGEESYDKVAVGETVEVTYAVGYLFGNYQLIGVEPEQ